MSSIVYCVYLQDYHNLHAISHLNADTPAAACLDFVPSSCGISAPSDTVTVLPEGKENARQTVFSVSRTWIVRIFELFDGYRQPTYLIAGTLETLQEVVPLSQFFTTAASCPRLSTMQ